MGWSSPDSWLTRLFSGDPIVILIAFLVTIALPSLVHLYFYAQTARTKTTPTFLLLGPSGAGKTSLVSLVSFLICHADPPTANKTSSYKNDPPIPKTMKWAQPTPAHLKSPPPSACCFRPPSLLALTNTGPRTMSLSKTSSPLHM